MNNNMIEELKENWDGSNWVNNWKNTFSYDGNNNRIERFRETWTGSTWENNEKDTYTYDGNHNRIELLMQEWDGSNWMNLNKYSYTYDVNNNMIEQLLELWDVSNWVNYYMYTYTYDGNNNMIEQLKENWDSSNWVNNWKEINSYIPLTGVEQLTDGIKAYSLSNNYPNPFNPSTKISYSINELSFVTLIVYDVLGNEIETIVNEEKPAGSYEIEFNADALTSGIYFYKLTAGSFAETKKMILLK